MWRALLGASLLGAVLAVEYFECPADETTGKFPDPDDCDVYWDCFQGNVTFVECADGFGFDPKRVQTQKEPCDYLFKVDCTGREGLAPPQGTGVCVRRNGYYIHEDPNICDKYYLCKDDLPLLLPCPPGLHFRLDTLTCDWPEAANRGACETKRSLPDGFECDPSIEYFTPAKQKIVHPNFPHPDDCRKFYICENGVQPKISRCKYGEVYNIDDAMCDIPLNVPECQNYYLEDGLEEEAYEK